MTSSDEKLFGDVGRKEAKPGHDIVHNAKQSEVEHVFKKIELSQARKTWKH